MTPATQEKPGAKKRRKVSFLEGIRLRLQEMAGLLQVLVNEPRAFPRALGRVLKRSMRSIWDARGGGLYACGFLVTFIWLEITTIGREIASSDSAVDFLGEQLFEMFFRFMSESFINSLRAFIWPVDVIAFAPPWGLIFLGVLYLLFSRVLKEPLTNWLFADDPSDQGEALADEDLPEDAGRPSA